MPREKMKLDPSCFAYSEIVLQDNSVESSCRLLRSRHCDSCKFRKTWEKYNSHNVEADIAAYAASHAEGST